jgi:signal transduction histidine kinase
MGSLPGSYLSSFPEGLAIVMDTIKRFWGNLPLASKLAGFTSLLVMVVVFTLTSLTVRRERTSFRQELEGQARLLLETLPLTMRDSLYRLELDELVDVASSVSDQETVTLFIVYDAQGATLVDAALSTPVFSQVVDPLGERLINLDPRQIYLDWQGAQLVAGRVIVLGNQRIGALAMGLSTAPLDEKITALTYQSIWLALGTLLLGAGAAFLLARQITRPLDTLTSVAVQMAGGDLETRVVVPRSTDEIGKLGDAFNQMADAIERRETELRYLAQGLERTVAARTSELRAQNRTLIQTNKALSLARKQAEAANRAKSGVLSVVSHELRTPMTSILGFTKLIKRRLSRVPDECARDGGHKVQRALEQVRSNIDIIDVEGERLVALINSMLDLAKIESGKVAWRMAQITVSDVIERSVAVTASLFSTKPLDLVVDVDDSLPPIQGDRDRLVQVMVNLISNAVKFTTEGSVTCHARLKPYPDAQDADSQAILISVQDTGIGIDPDDYDKVFEQYVQVGERPFDAPQGTGLGLPICKEIVEHHGGRIWVESTLGEGSTFLFTLPVSDNL